MRYFIGVDGGGTKTAFMLADESGKVVAEHTGPTSHYLQCGFDGLTEIIKTGKDALLTEAGISDPDIEFAFLGCAGYGDVQSDCPLVEKSVHDALGAIPFKVGNDSDNALAGALDGESGINIIAGTGSMASGYNEKTGEILRCGGWHHAIGSDEGSAYWFAWHILKEFTRQSDGRDEKTPLYDAVKNRLEIGEDDSEVITRVVDEWNLDRTKVASLCTLMPDLYDSGDAHAIRIVGLAAVELSDMASALRRRLGFSEGETVKVSGTGGVFNLGDRLIKPLSELLSGDDMEFTPSVHDPIYGSVILAMKKGK